MTSERLILLKVGGGAAINLEGIAADLATIEAPVVIVHGANALRDRLAEQLGTPHRVVTSVSGYTSVHSDDAAIELLMMAYAGLANKRLVECLQRHGRPAVGLTGLDGRLIEGRRNQGIRVRDGERTIIVRDRSGKPRTINRPLLDALLKLGLIPVLTVPLADETGSAINAENDDVVALLATELGAAIVVHLIEAPGLLADARDPGSRLDRLTPEGLQALEQAAQGRFKRKLRAIGQLLGRSRSTVLIADGRVAHPVVEALAGQATRIAHA